MVVRGCTTGMESRETQPALSQTRGEILFLERFGQSSDASDEIIAGLPRARTPWGTASRDEAAGSLQRPEIVAQQLGRQDAKTTRR
jgi:hypothetical protein